MRAQLFFAQKSRNHGLLVTFNLHPFGENEKQRSGKTRDLVAVHIDHDLLFLTGGEMPEALK